MPIYCMNVFKIPQTFCNDLDRVMADFWWEKGRNKKGKHWYAWKRLCLPKREGGLGFRDMAKFNLALLGKQAWRIFQQPQSLVARVLKGRYFPQANVLNAKTGKQPSYIWHSILAGRDMLIKGLRFIIGDGKMINAWMDPWLPTSPPRPARPLTNNPDYVSVNDLMHKNVNIWDILKLRELVHQDDIDRISNIKLFPSATADYLGWNYTNHGQYTVKSAYWLATHHPSYEAPHPPTGNQELKTKIWRLRFTV